jgi:hypothetical protein
MRNSTRKMVIVLVVSSVVVIALWIFGLLGEVTQVVY